MVDAATCFGVVDVDSGSATQTATEIFDDADVHAFFEASKAKPQFVSLLQSTRRGNVYLVRVGKYDGVWKPLPRPGTQFDQTEPSYAVNPRTREELYAALYAYRVSVVLGLNVVSPTLVTTYEELSPDMANGVDRHADQEEGTLSLFVRGRVMGFNKRELAALDAECTRTLARKEAIQAAALVDHITYQRDRLVTFAITNSCMTHMSGPNNAVLMEDGRIGLMDNERAVFVVPKVDEYDDFMDPRVQSWFFDEMRHEPIAANLIPLLQSWQSSVESGAMRQQLSHALQPFVVPPSQAASESDYLDAMLGRIEQVSNTLSVP